jgi:hypothetical protein
MSKRFSTLTINVMGAFADRYLTGSRQEQGNRVGLFAFVGTHKAKV